MKKVLTISLIVIFALMGIPAVLSVLPHTHGHDFDHSKHSACPVYQLSQIGFFALGVIASFILITRVLARHYVQSFSSVDSFSLHSFSLRGPPSFLA